MRPNFALLVSMTVLFACEIQSSSYPSQPAPTRPNSPSPATPTPPVTTETTPAPSTPVATTLTNPEVVPTPAAIDWTLLQGEWWDSREREGDVRVFVRVYPGPSRFRQHLTFGETEATFMKAAKNDRHYKVRGTWSRRGETVSMTGESRGEHKSKSFDVVSISDTELRIRYR